MSLTVLTDLDNTLLSNDMERFLPAYLKKLSSYLPEWPAEKIIKELLAGTNRMIAKNTPANTLEQSFDAVFYPGLGADRADLQQKIDSFYRDGFPTLKGLSAPRPEAKSLAEYLIRKKFTIAIATNPLFPRTAIEQRLDWAGLSNERDSFDLISSYERLHFSKPNPAYYAEILAQLGWPDQPAVMIGDNLEEDILPATRLGLPAFWVNGKDLALPYGLHPLSSKGKLGDVKPWLENINRQPVEMLFSTPASVLAILKSTPAALDTLTRKLNADQWKQRPADNEWSLTEITCHLRDVDIEVNLPRMKRVSSGENPFVPGIVTDVWAEERDYYHQDGIEALASFIRARTELVELLDKLDDQSWKLPARHTIFGPTQLVELAAFISTHDRTHVHQASETIKRLAAE